MNNSNSTIKSFKNEQIKIFKKYIKNFKPESIEYLKLKKSITDIENTIHY